MRNLRSLISDEEQKKEMQEPFSLTGARGISEWCNSVLSGSEHQLSSLADLSSGEVLVEFVERLCHATLGKRFKKPVQNVELALQFLAKVCLSHFFPPSRPITVGKHPPGDR